MFFGNLGLHVIEGSPSARWHYVGRIPTVLGETVPATKADIMGGRAWREDDGGIVTTQFPVFETKQEAFDFARARGAEVIADA